MYAIRSYYGAEHEAGPLVLKRPWIQAHTLEPTVPMIVDNDVHVIQQPFEGLDTGIV